MTPEEKSARLLEISKSTLNETIEKLNILNRVLVVRPTGFGKSYMLAGLTSSKLNSGHLRFKKCLYIYPTKVIKQDVINTYGPCGKDERANMLLNTTFISYSKITNMISDINKTKTTTVQGLELYSGIVDISNDGDWRSKENKKLFKAKEYSETIHNFQGQDSLRQWISQFDLIMLDECHKVCSDGFLGAWDKIGSIITDQDTSSKSGRRAIKLVGVTATPYRLDGKDIGEVLGKNNQISKLTLSDCIKQGLLSKFDYVYAIGDRNKFFNSAAESINELRKKNNSEKLTEYESVELRRELNNIKPMSDIIKESIKPENTGGSSYMRFVVFFKNKTHIDREGALVESWFRNAFIDSDTEIQVTNIVTKSSECDVDYEISDVDALEELDKQKTDNKIDLIFCVDKLNMGYHVESITGIVLLRETNSAVIYNQQIGRCFSVRSMTKPIIFDIVDKVNIGTILNSESKGKKKAKEGEKSELPSIIDSSCVDIYNYSASTIKVLNSIRNQEYKVDELIVRFLSENRHAPVDVIATMTGYEIDRIKEILCEEE